MIVHIDNDFKCHVANDGTMIEVQSDFFDGKCSEFVEGYRFIPEGKIWTREDGTTFVGEMITPWKPFHELESAQCKYERELAQAARILLGGN